MRNDETSLVFDEIEKETDAAYYFVFEDEKVWLPKSQVRVYEKNKKVFLPEWLAEKEGLV